MAIDIAKIQSIECRSLSISCCSSGALLYQWQRKWHLEIFVLLAWIWATEQCSAWCCSGVYRHQIRFAFMAEQVVSQWENTLHICLPFLAETLINHRYNSQARVRINFWPWLHKICRFRYDDFIMSAMAPQITSLTIICSSVYSGADKKISKLRVTALCAGNSPVTGEFPSQKASNAENVSIWWRHHILFCRFFLWWIGTHMHNNNSPPGT